MHLHIHRKASNGEKTDRTSCQTMNSRLWQYDSYMYSYSACSNLMQEIVIFDSNVAHAQIQIRYLPCVICVLEQGRYFCSFNILGNRLLSIN